MMRKLHTFSFFLLTSSFVWTTFVVHAEPIREWDWHMPGFVYKELDFTDRASVDRAVKLFERAVDAERRGVKVTDLVPMYRAAAGEWRKVQVQAETAGGNESLLAYAVFMQGYAKQQSRDRNEAIKLFNEVLDLYPEEKFIAVPARYMLSIVKRQLGDIKQANADLEAIVEDGGADGHILYFNVLRTLAANRWAEGRMPEAIEFWEKIVFSKANVDGSIRFDSRNDLITARVISSDFDNLMNVLLVGASNKPSAKREALAANAGWISEIDAYGHHPVTRYLDWKFPREKKAFERQKELERIRKGYIAWFEQESGAFNGVDDGWTLALIRLRLYRSIEKKEAIQKRINTIHALVKGAKPDALTGRARTLAYLLLGFGMSEEARVVAALPKDALARLMLQYDVECELRQWKTAVMYLEQYMNTKPGPTPGELSGAKWKLANHCRRHLGTPERAIKIYLDLNEPPATLWALAETYRDVGKKKESYTTLTEIISIFPDDAPNAVLRMGQWKEADGEKEKAIGCYRQLLKHPKWKQSGASSQAHQALERLGIATGGAMTNEVR